VIGYQWPNVAPRVVTCMHPKWAFYPFFLMCTPDQHPFSLTRFKRPKTVKVRNFTVSTKKWTKPIYFDIDLLRKLPDPSDQHTTHGLPFQTSLYSSSLLFFCFGFTTSHTIPLSSQHMFNGYIDADSNFPPPVWSEYFASSLRTINARESSHASLHEKT
jgi:hypothetical protein